MLSKGSKTFNVGKTLHVQRCSNVKIPTNFQDLPYLEFSMLFQQAQKKSVIIDSMLHLNVWEAERAKITTLQNECNYNLISQKCTINVLSLQYNQTYKFSNQLA